MCTGIVVDCGGGGANAAGQGSVIHVYYRVASRLQAARIPNIQKPAHCRVDKDSTILWDLIINKTYAKHPQKSCLCVWITVNYTYLFVETKGMGAEAYGSELGTVLTTMGHVSQLR